MEVFSTVVSFLLIKISVHFAVVLQIGATAARCTGAQQGPLLSHRTVTSWYAR